MWDLIVEIILGAWLYLAVALAIGAVAGWFAAARKPE